MRKFLAGTAVALAGLAGTVGSSENANALGFDGSYTLNVCGGGSALISCGPYGSVTITGDQTNSLTFAFLVTNGARIHDGGHTSVVMNVLGTVSGSIITNADTNWTQDTNGINADGLGNSFNVGFNCAGSGSGSSCGDSVTVTLVANSGVLSVQSNPKDGFTTFAGIDVTCNRDTGATCSLTQFGGGETGMVGATAVSVPGPAVGAGIPGLIFASAGVAAWWRRRKKVQLAA